MSTQQPPRRRGSSFIEEHLRTRFLPDLRTNDTTFPDNPTRVDKPFWKFMISRGDKDAYDARNWFGVPVPEARRWNDEPLFCFQRFGRTETRLPDGRIVFIGGEHEDYYDPDFCIYNDVVVVHRQVGVEEEESGSGAEDDEADAHSESGSECELTDLEIKMEKDWREMEMEEELRNAASAAGAQPDDIEIYGYPTDVFPPTDFHTATYVKEEDKEYIYIIGGLGYGSPHDQATLTPRLDLQDYSIQRVETSGDAPPPRMDIRSDRTAELQGDRIIYKVRSEEYVLSLADMRWSKSS